MALAAVHVGLVNYYIPLANVFSDRPLTGTDYDLHIGQVKRVVEGLEGWGKGWVYDVKLVAGQPEGTITDSGSKGWELWTYVWHASGARFSVAFNSFVWFVMLCAPLLIYAAARMFEFDALTSLLAAAFLSCAWFFDSILHYFWFVGMISWAGACCLNVLTLGIFVRFLATQRVRYALLCAAALGLGLLIHPYTFFALAPPMAASYLRGIRTRPRVVHGAVAGIALVALAINVPWLSVSAKHWHYILDSGFYAPGGIRYVWSDFFDLVRSGDTGLIGVRSGFRVLYLGLALAWFVSVWRQGDARSLPLAVALASTLAIAYFAGYVPGGAQIQPYRHISAATLFSVVPAAAFVRSAIAWRVFSGLRRELKCMLVVVGVCVFQHLSVEALYFVPNALPEPEPYPDGTRFPLSIYGFPAFCPPSHIHYGVPHDEQIEIGLNDTIRWLVENAPAGSRLLTEGAPFGERLAWSTDFEVMGGFLERNVAHAYANYFRRYANHRATAAELAEYLKTFGIGYVVVILEHPEIERSDLVELAYKSGVYRVYRVRIPVDRLLQGRGEVRAQTNRIDVRGTDPHQPLVLSYHYHEALRCEPGCRLEREPNPLDQVGFIRVPAPHPKDLSIVNSYRW